MSEPSPPDPDLTLTDDPICDDCGFLPQDPETPGYCKECYQDMLEEEGIIIEPNKDLPDTYSV